VCQISIQALKIHTGQSKGFQANSDSLLRAQSIEEWEKWLADYCSNL